MLSLYCKKGYFSCLKIITVERIGVAYQVIHHLLQPIRAFVSPVAAMGLAVLLPLLRADPNNGEKYAGRYAVSRGHEPAPVQIEAKRWCGRLAAAKRLIHHQC